MKVATRMNSLPSYSIGYMNNTPPGITTFINNEHSQHHTRANLGSISPTASSTSTVDSTELRNSDTTSVISLPNNNNTTTANSVSPPASPPPTLSHNDHHMHDPHTTQPAINDGAPQMGLSHWEQQRNHWRRNHQEYNENSFESFRSHPALEAVEEAHYETIFSSIVHNQRRFARPVPLDFVTTVLVHGWKAEGLFTPPPGYDAQQQS
ncbi:hypothetical protein SmJEL517_g06223 [Synchytrium microbalum]|uniref:Gag1-like clamp domain-containing protein n=1 Tax=Synchytrium microbalum TaxID=1806994 RepID=A0A507BQN7_9FUNG|nr:uncharacterized protein SmJEL517_g06223 [Synchytrium microbalum]TPX30142.1 hypothetical protein SmJEL517_g06223 [Synchytrium microbalum]